MKQWLYWFDGHQNLTRPTNRNYTSNTKFNRNGLDKQNLFNVSVTLSIARHVTTLVIDKWLSTVHWRNDNGRGKQESSGGGGDDPVAFPLCSLPIPQGMAWDSTPTSEVRDPKRISQLSVTQCTFKSTNTSMYIQLGYNCRQFKTQGNQHTSSQTGVLTVPQSQTQPFLETWMGSTTTPQP
jgi:hypothetical protein